MLAMSVLSALIAIVEVSLFAFMGSIVDWLAVTDPETLFSEKSAALILMALVLLVVFPLLAILQTVLVHQTLLGNLPMVIRWQAHRYVLKQSQTFFNNEFAGRIGTKVMQTSLAVRETVMKLLDILVYIAVYFLSVLVLMAGTDWRLMLPFLAWLIFYLAVLFYFVPRLSEVSTKQADARALMTGRVIDSYTNIATVKLFSHAGREADYAKAGMDGFLTTVYKQMRLSSGFQICVDVSGMVLMAVTLLVGLLLWKENAVGAGAVAVALAVILRLHGLSHWIMWEVSALFENIGIVRDGINTLAREREVVDRPDATELVVNAGGVEFNEVSFDYVQQLPVIKDMTLQIAAGEKVGIVGRSGAGKTTLVNLLLRLYDLNQGRIAIDGTDIAAVSQDSLRANISVVTQDTSLLHRSVFDNIAYGRRDANHEEVVTAARRANAEDFIRDLVDVNGYRGFDAMVGERGVTLSGGQRQRIAIARVFLKDAPILILDEATSALDSEVEAAIQENLNALMKGKTVLAIAHRLSTISQMDRLIVMEKGQIIESGSHDELIAGNGLYSDLWKRQSGGFLE